jgi:hypothetical protein
MPSHPRPGPDRPDHRPRPGPDRPDHRPRPGPDRPDHRPRSGSGRPAHPRSGSGQPTHPRPGPGQPDHRQRPAIRRSIPQFSNRTDRSGDLGGVGRVLAAVAGSAARGGRAAGSRALAVATGELGRRLARAVGSTVVLVVLVMTLYERGEVPSVAAQPALRAPAVDAPGGTGRDAAARRRDPSGAGGLRGRPRPSPVGERPTAVAAAWYAARQGLPRAKVKPLQLDRRSAREVRVLVLADHGRGRLQTALVRVRLGRTGWSVR